MAEEWETRREQVRALVREVLGEEPDEVAHMDFGHQSLTYDVALPGRSLIVRTNDDLAAYRAMERNLATLAGLGLPVPRVLVADLSGAGVPFAWMVMTKIPGRDLRYELGSMTRPQMTRLAERIAGFQRRVMALPVRGGFGYAPLDETGPFPTLWDFLHEGEAATRGVTEPRLAALIRAREDEWRRASPTCFLDDVTIKNVLVWDGELQGLVDFDFVCYGDPRFWLGLTATVVVCDVGVERLFYVDELCRFLGWTGDDRRVVALYAAWVSLGFVRRHGAGETEAWRARMAAARERWLEEAEA